MRVLLLGGTAEARALAAELVAAGVDVVTSLAGAVAGVRSVPGGVRVGGFGGVDGLVGYLTAEGIDRVVDATHPFAATMTAHAAEACARTAMPLLRLARPGWAGRAEAASWRWVDSLAAARTAAELAGERVFLAVGRQSIGPFLEWEQRYVLLRVVDPPEVTVPASWEVLRARGPFGLDSERDLLLSRRIDVLVTKDSGGDATAAKLDAAAELCVPVVIVARPAEPAGVPVAQTVTAALRWVTG